MGRKYIIEIGRLERLYKAFIGAHGKPEITWLSPEVDLTPYTEPNMEQVRKEAYDKAFEDAEQVAESGKRAMYQKGLKDAWEAARKIIDMPEADLLNLFPECYAAVCTSVQVFLKYDASECIEKIRAYEQGKEEIKVGDEVEAVSGKAVIIEVLGNGKDVRYMYPDASTGFNDSCNVTRTGRHFPEIAEVLRKMKEADNG